METSSSEKSRFAKGRNNDKLSMLARESAESKLLFGSGSEHERSSDSDELVESDRSTLSSSWSDTSLASLKRERSSMSPQELERSEE